MAKFELIESPTHLDAEVEVGFEKALEANATVEVLAIIIEVLSDPILAHLVDGVIDLAVTPYTLRIRLRYSKTFPGKSGPGAVSSEDFSRWRAQLIFYLCAKIDRQHTLGDVPFPDNFRYFLSFPDHLQNLRDRN